MRAYLSLGSQTTHRGCSYLRTGVLKISGIFYFFYDIVIICDDRLILWFPFVQFVLTFDISAEKTKVCGSV